MPRTEVTKKTLAVSIDIEVEQKLREIAKAESRSISYIVERSIAQTIAQFEGREQPIPLDPSLENKRLWEEIRHLHTAYDIVKEHQIWWERLGYTIDQLQVKLPEVAEESGDNELSYDRIGGQKEQMEDGRLDVEHVEAEVNEQFEAELAAAYDAAVEQSSSPQK
jgi:hypothetical protein